MLERSDTQQTLPANDAFGVFGNAAISDIRAPRQVHHLLVATPGRLVELLAVNAVSLERVTMLTLDEADRMLELGFEPQLETISAAIRPDRQVGPLPPCATTQGPMR